MTKLSIRTSIFSVIILLVALISLSLLVSQYYFSEKLAFESTSKAFTSIARNITKHLMAEGSASRNILAAKRQHAHLVEPISFSSRHPALESLIQVLQVKHNIYAIYFAQENGDFYEVVNMQASSQLFQAYSAPEKTAWTVITIINNQQQLAFLNDKLELISMNTRPKKYDPRLRSWYIKAMETDEIISTDPYLFSHLNQEGITYASHFGDNRGVVALDYTMDELNELLAQQKYDDSSEISIVNKAGSKVASSSFISQEKLREASDNSFIKSNDRVDAELLKAVLEGKTEHIIKYAKADSNYFSIILPVVNNNFYLLIKTDADRLLKPYKDSVHASFLIAFFLLVLSLPIIYFGTSLIIRPIKALILQNDKIKNRHFQLVENIDTYISEFEDLSNSFVSMSQSIEAFDKKQEQLLDSIIQLIAEAIDAKSPYTGGHCKRVPEIAQLLLDEASRCQHGVFKDFCFNDKDQLREFEIGAWLHDCGKVATPEYVVDKATKLETIYNRIHEIRMRFEVLWRDAQIDYLNKTISIDELHARQAALQDDFEFIANANMGGEFMSEEKQSRVKEIAEQEWQRHFDDRLGLGDIENLRYEQRNHIDLPVSEKLLSDKVEHIVARENFDHQAYEKEGFKLTVPEHLYNHGEVHNLCIEKGTLNAEERYKINEHIILSIKMLEKIPFPEHLANVPEYAGTHHETLIGTGYPRKLSKDQLSIPARIMAIADIFEALTASDRPYKKAKPLSVSLKIMSFMVKDEHIDADLFRLFLESRVYKIYAEKYLDPEQIDEVNIDRYLT
jgi:HD-GYP domain-containing protein (c-di-GMP phosphodiesterase class II)